MASLCDDGTNHTVHCLLKILNIILKFEQNTIWAIMMYTILDNGLSLGLYPADNH